MLASLKVLLSLGGLTPKELAARVRRAMKNDDIFNRAAILGFYFMLALGVLIISALVLVLYGGQVAEALSGALRLGGAFSAAWGVIRWPVVLAFVFLAFGLIYYFAPNLHEQKFRWVLPGMVVGVILWLAASLGFRLYLRYFNTYNAVYGSLGAVIILMLWFYLTGAAILVGGEVNTEIERAAAAAGEKEAKRPGEKSPGRKDGKGAAAEG
jgi:membrane protein